MRKLECDVIQDLLPSYVDGICSETSKRYVEEHIEDCPECDQLMRQLRDTDFSTSKLEQREFDGYKRVKRQISRQSMSGVLLAVALILSTIAGARLIVYGGGMRSVPTYYVLLGICILCSIYFTQIRKPEATMQKADWCMTILSILGTVYLTWLLFYCLAELEAGRMPFEGVVAVGRLGMFVRYQLNAVAILQMLMYVILLWRLIRKKINNGWVLILCLTGGCVSHLYETYLGSMDLTPETLWHLIPTWLEMALIALGIGLVGIVLSLILSKERMKKERGQKGGMV